MTVAMAAQKSQWACRFCCGDNVIGSARACGVPHLTNWDKERGQDKANPDNSAIMGPIAHNLRPKRSSVRSIMVLAAPTSA